MKLSRRIISGWLVLCLLISMMPVTAWAEDGSREIAVEELSSGETTQTIAPETEEAVEPTLEVPEETTVPVTEETVPANTVPDQTEAAPEPETVPSDPTEAVTEPAQDNNPQVSDPEEIPGAEPSAANGVVDSGSCGENLTWKLDSAGILTISGTGAMEDYENGLSRPWVHSQHLIQSVIIENGVTSIGSRAFGYCSGMTSVTIPESVTKIGSYAFENCGGLVTVTIPASVTGMGVASFSGCGGLTGLVIEEGAAQIGDRAFMNCNSLTGVTIPGSVESIGDSSFYNCGKLSNVVIRSGVTNIGSSAFEGCKKLTGVTMESGVADIGDAAFRGCDSLTDISIPDSVTRIGDDVFSECINLRSVTIMGKKTDIGSCAFYGCSGLREVHIPGSVSTIAAYAFANCNQLSSIQLPDGLTSIKADAFEGCTSLKTVILPDTLSGIGAGAFSHCTGLQRINLPAGVRSIGKGAFQASGLTELIIPTGVTRIETDTFYECKSLSRIVIPTTVTYIGTCAFDRCSALKTVCYTGTQAQLEKIDCESYGNDVLRYVTVVTGYTNIATGVCGKNLTWELSLDGTLIISGSGPMYDYPVGDDSGPPWSNYCSQIKAVKFNGKITSIGENALGLTAIKNITIPASITAIGYNALCNIQTLEGIWVDKSNAVYCSDASGVLYNKDKTILIQAPTRLQGKYSVADETTWIYEGAFSRCTGLTSIHIPILVARIDHNCFFNCTGLKDVYYAGTEEQWGKITITPWCNEPLLEANLHTNSLSGTIFYYHSWDPVNRIAGFGPDSFFCYQVTDDTDGAFRDNPRQYVGRYVLVEVKEAATGEELGTLIRIRPLETISGIVDSATASSVTVEGTTYPAADLSGKEAQYKGKFALCHLYQNRVIRIAVLEEKEGLLAVLDKENGKAGIRQYADDTEMTEYTISAAACKAITAFLDRTPSLEYAYPTRVRLWADGQKLVYGMEEVPFRKAVYHADNLLEDEAINISDLMTQINKYSPAMWILENGTADDWAQIWDSVNILLGSLADGDEHAKYKFKQADIYETILLNAMECATGDESAISWTVSTANKVVKSTKSILSFLDTNIKVKYNWELIEDRKIDGLSDAQKKQLKEELENALRSSGYADTVDILKKSGDFLGDIMKIATTSKDLIEKVMLYLQLWEVSETMAAVLEQMLVEIPETYENLPMRDAIVFCKSMIEQTQFDQFKRGVLLRANALETGEYAVTELLSYFWKKAKEKAVESNPKLLVLLAAYKLSHTVTNFAFGTDNISEELMKLKAVSSYEIYLEKAIRSMRKQYLQSHSNTDAEELLEAVGLLYSFAVEDCDIACSYAKAVEDTVAHKITSAMGSIGDSIKDLIGKKEEPDEEVHLAEYAKNTREYFIKSNVDAAIHWVHHLYGDFPEYYREYANLIGDNRYKNALVVRITTNYMIECPVDVRVYDRNGKLVADLNGDGAFAFGDISAVQIGDRKLVTVRNSDRYRVSCVGYDEGTMDISVAEYRGTQKLRDSKFISLDVQKGKTYHLESKADPLDKEIHTIVCDEETIPADYDSANTQCSEHRYDTAKFRWNEDHSCTAVFVCANRDSLEQVECTVTNTTAIGMNPVRSITTYTAVAEFAGQRYRDSIEVVGEASPVEEISISQQYLALKRGEGATLTVTVLPKEYSTFVQWGIEPGGEATIRVDKNGNVTTVGTGTAYVVASVTDGNVTLTDRCRVDVTRTMDIKGIQLSTIKATSELFSTAYTELDVLLMLEQNMDASLASKEDPQIPDANSIAIEAAAFKDEATAKFFELKPLDDRRLAIVPTDYAIKNPREVKGSYKSAVVVKLGEQEYESEILTLTVKKTAPKLKVTVPAFNSFYSGQSQDLVITGGTVTKVEANALPEWLTLKGQTLSLNDKAPTKSASGKASLKVYTEEWRIPAEVTLTVKNTYKAPGLKLSASSVTLAKADSNGVVLKLVPSNKKDTLTSLNVSGITAPEGYTISGFDTTTGEFTLKGSTPGKITLNVSFHGTDKTLPLKLTVKTADVKLKLSKSSVTLNKKVADSAEVAVTATPADYNLNLQDYRLTDAKGVDKKGSGELTVRLNGDKITVATNTATPANATYKLYVSAGGSKEAVLTIKTIEKEPTVTFKAKGNLDLSFPKNEVIITPTFKNYSGSFTFDKVETENFTLTQDGSTIVANCKSDAAPGTYTQKLILTLEDGSTVENTVKITVKRTAVKLKLGASKLTLNHKVRDIGEIGVTCTTKGYDFQKPDWTLMDKSGKAEVKDALNISWQNGKLVIGTNDATVYGGTYKLLVKATENDSAVTLTITIPAENKSAVTATIKAKGSIDVIRDGSAIILTPTYKNVTAQTVKKADLVFTKTVNKVTTNADDLFRYTANADGTFTITKAEGAKLDHSAKYTVELVSTVNGQPVTVKPISLSVKQGSAKLTVSAEDTTLFANDRYDRVPFRISSEDVNLNEALAVQIRDEKYRSVFKIIPYENNVFSIGFLDGSIHDLLGKSNAKTITVNLNIWMDGNCTEKANASAALKLYICRAPLAEKIRILQGGEDVTGRTVMLYEGDSFMLTGKSEPQRAVDSFVWSSSDPTVATVDSRYGVIEGRNAGTAVITCATIDGSGLTASITVHVQKTEWKKLEINKTYCMGDVLDYQNMNLRAYSDRGCIYPTSDYICSPSVFTEAGTHQVTVTYRDITETFTVEVLDFYEQSIRLINAHGNNYNPNGKAYWALYITGRYEGNYVPFSFRDDISNFDDDSVDFAECWEIAQNGRGTEWGYECTDMGYGQYHGGHVFLLPDNPALAGTYTAKLTFGDVVKNVRFVLEYQGNYTTGTGWKVSGIRWYS